MKSPMMDLEEPIEFIEKDPTCAILIIVRWCDNNVGAVVGLLAIWLICILWTTWPLNQLTAPPHLVEAHDLGHGGEDEAGVEVVAQGLHHLHHLLGQLLLLWWLVGQRGW